MTSAPELEDPTNLPPAGEDGSRQARKFRSRKSVNDKNMNEKVRKVKAMQYNNGSNASGKVVSRQKCRKRRPASGRSGGASAPVSLEEDGSGAESSGSG